jgi:hypothetical protein
MKDIVDSNLSDYCCNFAAFRRAKMFSTFLESQQKNVSKFGVYFGLTSYLPNAIAIFLYISR